MRDLRRLSEEKTNNYTIVKIAGGNNGSPDWYCYFSQLGDMVLELENEFNTANIVLEKIDTDMLDDVFYATFYIYNN